MLKRKYKNVYYFLVPIKKELDNGKSIKYKIKFIDIFRFMSSKLSDLVVDDLSEIYSRECKGCKKRKKLSDFIGLKNNKLDHKCNKCKKDGLHP